MNRVILLRLTHSRGDACDYLTFYAAGQADALPLPLIGYEILHTYQHATDLIGARAHYIGWKSRIWRTALNRAVTRIAARSAV